MLLVVAYIIAFTFGLGCAAAAHHELRIQTANVMSSKVSRAFTGYLLLVYLPVVTYFYWFHGDWLLTYALPTAAVPSAIALLGAILLVMSGWSGFWVGAQLRRAEQKALVLGMLAVGVCGAAILVWMSAQRVHWVGSHEQYSGGYGLRPFARDHSLQRGLLVGLSLVSAGYAHLIVRLARVRHG